MTFKLDKNFISLESIQSLQLYLPDETMLNGILQTGNRNLFEVSSSSQVSEDYGPEKALDDEDSYFHSEYHEGNKDPDPWYKIKFKDLFYIQNYTFKTRHKQDDFFPSKWELEGSFDDDKYQHIDSQNVTDLNENNKAKIFKVDTPNIFKYFKFHNFITADGQSVFVIRSIDFFGCYINEKFIQRLTPYIITNLNILHISLYTIILSFK